jgi:cell division protein FtsB
MELSEELLNDIDFYVKDVLISNNAKVIKSRLKKAYETKGEEDAGVQKFLLWRSYELKLRDMKTRVIAAEWVAKKLESGVSSEELYADLKRENILTKHHYDTLKAQNERLTEKCIKLNKQIKNDSSNRAAILRAKEKESKYDEKIAVIADLRKENRELTTERDYFKKRCKQLENEITPEVTDVDGPWGISDEQIYGSYYEDD